jgi:hypothetical protein
MVMAQKGGRCDLRVNEYTALPLPILARQAPGSCSPPRVGAIFRNREIERREAKRGGVKEREEL